MDQFNGAEAAVRMLQLYGVRHIFGLCGDTSLPFYDALYKMEHGMTHVLTRDLLDSPPSARNYSGLAALMPGVRMSNTDVGGNQQMEQIYMRVHGSRQTDTTVQVDGMPRAQPIPGAASHSGKRHSLLRRRQGT